MTTMADKLADFLADRTALGAYAPGVAAPVARRLIESGWVTAGPAAHPLDEHEQLVLQVLAEWPRPHMISELAEQRRLFAYSRGSIAGMCSRLYERGLLDCHASF